MRNVDKREKFIQNFGGKDRKKGERRFFEIGETDEQYKKLRELPPPPKFKWIYRHFMTIWQNCEYDFGGNVIFTFRTVNEYVECMKVPFTVEEKRLLFKMKQWALEAISELKEKDKD